MEGLPFQDFIISIVISHFLKRICHNTAGQNIVGLEIFRANFIFENVKRLMWWIVGMVAKQRSEKKCDDGYIVIITNNTTMGIVKQNA